MRVMCCRVNRRLLCAAWISRASCSKSGPPSRPLRYVWPDELRLLVVFSTVGLNSTSGVGRPVLISTLCGAGQVQPSSCRHRDQLARNRGRVVDAACGAGSSACCLRLRHSLWWRWCSQLSKALDSQAADAPFTQLTARLNAVTAAVQALQAQPPAFSATPSV